MSYRFGLEMWPTSVDVSNIWPFILRYLYILVIITGFEPLT